MVIVTVAGPGVRSLAEGTDAELEPGKPNAGPAKPGRPSWTENSVPSWPATESCMTVPDVSSMCHSATTPTLPELAWTTAVAFEVAVAKPTEFEAVTTTRTVLPTSVPVSV